MEIQGFLQAEAARNILDYEEALLRQTRPIGLILDPRFKGDISRLAAAMPIWVLATGANEELLDNAGLQLIGKSPIGAPGVTLMRVNDGEMPSDLLARALGNIDDHHGPVTTKQPYDAIHVYGLSRQFLRPEVMLELGVTSVEDTDFGFVAFIDRGGSGT